MAQAKNGDTVKVHYTGKLNDGTVFDSSEGREPLEFVVGTGEIIPGFEEAVIGMNEGETKTVTIPADKAYGPHNDELVLVVGREQVPPDLKVKIGDLLQVTLPDGHRVDVTVTALNDEAVTLDANHPLAGQDLTFEIELVSIGPATSSSPIIQP